MLENMAGAVGFAMHEDRLARAAENLRLIEAEWATGGQRTGGRGPRKERVARTLVALALRLSPGIAVERLALAE